ncbi:hypothetical protein AVEN_177835-1 [Araneus ventricosus]|uniref:Uncharacterized protein n=1 Tax=Araneus ventricosus TaxID=182803 RepID=A0A4Y2JJ15_ARAVE|nr:hypothetical protein AVEN_177835-1 [Araneus ventricosus]
MILEFLLLRQKIFTLLLPPPQLPTVKHNADSMICLNTSLEKCVVTSDQAMLPKRVLNADRCSRGIIRDIPGPFTRYAKPRSKDRVQSDQRKEKEALSRALRRIRTHGTGRFFC